MKVNDNVSIRATKIISEDFMMNQHCTALVMADYGN